MSEASQTLGELLKTERERRGLSTQKVADEMHLDAWVIEALEAGDYERIGPQVYAKGHLKKYASILGLAPADIAVGYETAPVQPAASAPQHTPLRMRSTAAQPTDWAWPQMAAFAVIALGIGGIFWWRPWHHRGGLHTAAAITATPASTPLRAETPGEIASRAAAGSAAGQNAQRPAAPMAEISSHEPEADAAVPPPFDAPVAASAVAVMSSKAAGVPGESDAPLGVGPARLRLSFSADSWVDVHDATGRRVFAGNGSANSVKTIAGMAPLRVYLGFASGVQLELNGRVVAIGPQFVTGDVAHFEAGADGVLRRDSHVVPTNAVPPRTAPPHG
jgi:cytoskeleton protein RodZ